VQAADAGIERGDSGDLLRGHRENASNEQLLDLLPALGYPVEHEDREGGGHGVDDADDGLLGKALALSTLAVLARHCEEGGAGHGEG